MAIFIYLILIILTYCVYKLCGPRKEDYFEKKGVKYEKPKPYIAALEIFYKKRSLPQVALDWYNKFKDEKISGFFEFKRPVFFVRDPQLIKKLTVKDFDYFADRRIGIPPESDPLFGKALISLQGQKWRDMRSILSPAFTGLKMRLMFDFVTKVGKQTAETLKQQINDGKNKEFEFKELTTKFTVDNIASCAFGIEVNSFENPDNDFHKMAQQFSSFGSVKTIFQFFGVLFIPSIMKFFKITFFDKKINEFFEKVIPDMIKVREQKGIIRHDMIQLLMQAKKGSLKHESEENEKITEGFATVEESNVGRGQVKSELDDMDLAAQCFIFFLAGFDTVASTMSFMGYELAVNQNIQQRLFEEIQSTEQKLDGKLLTYEKLQNMKYLDQVLSEVLRMWPPAPFSDRLCVKDYNYDYDGKKFLIEKGYHFIFPIWPIHHDAQYFPNPEKFNPERFSDENKGNIPEYTYMPFGVGPRNCIGSRFALMEVKSIFYYLLLNFKIMTTPKTPIPLELVKIPFGLKVKDGTLISLNPR